MEKLQGIINSRLKSRIVRWASDYHTYSLKNQMTPKSDTKKTTKLIFFISHLEKPLNLVIIVWRQMKKFWILL